MNENSNQSMEWNMDWSESMLIVYALSAHLICSGTIKPTLSAQMP